MESTNHVHRFGLNVVQELNPRERMVSNVVGVIGGVALGPIAAIGAAFLTVILASGIGVLPLVGISLLVGTGATIAAFFIFRKATSELIKAVKHTDQLVQTNPQAPANSTAFTIELIKAVKPTNQPVQTNPQAPANSTAFTMPIPKLVSQVSIDSCKQQLQTCISHVSAMVNNFEGTLSNMGVSKEGHYIPGQVIEFTHFTMNQLTQTIYNILATPGLTVDQYKVYLQQYSQHCISHIEEQISKFETTSNISNSNLLRPNLDSSEAIKEYQKQTNQRQANQLAVTLLTTFRLTIGNLFNQIEFNDAFRDLK